ncbi:uncharacterized protein JCM15063_002017 [Sporobolomyces koalae]|uniref:uncharacterized protein n=1 Tax=Sporobolomyces koalae TaxID=500713 RepID=UPI003176B707
MEPALVQAGVGAEATTFSTSRRLIAQHLANLVSTVQAVPEDRLHLEQLVHECVRDSFGPAAVKGGEDSETSAWKAHARRCIIEHALDQVVLDAVQSSCLRLQRARRADPPILQAESRNDAHLELALDLMLTCVEADYADEIKPLTTLAGLMESRPISACESLLGYIETRVERLTKDMEYTRGRGPILLRLLNDLLRRFPRSKPEPVILSGRILMLLSSVYPLEEKSGVNLRGNFNVGKGTVWEQDNDDQRQSKSTPEADKVSNQDEQDGDTEDAVKVESMEVEEGEEEEAAASQASTPAFYSTFWSLQRYFNNPHLLFKQPSPSSSSSPTPLETLYTSLLTVLAAFSEESKKEKELTGSKTDDSSRTSRKGKQVESMPPEESESSLEESFFPKFLTSRNLLSLELSDPTFRLQLLLQTLILTQYLLSLTPTGRTRAQSLPLTNTTAFPAFVLGKDDEKRLREIEDKSWNEVETMPHHESIRGGGKTVRKALESVLSRERNWTDWKLRSCAPFTKPSIPISQTAQTAQTKLNNMTRKPPRFPYKLGNARLSRVWMNDLKSLQGFEPDVTDDEFDPIIREWRMTKKRIEMTRAQLKQLGPASNPRIAELESSIEPMTIKLQALQFRAIRSASTLYLRHFHKIGSGDVEQLLQEIENERREREEQEEREQQLESEQIRSELVGQDEVRSERDQGVQEKEEEEKAAIRLGDTPVPGPEPESEGKSEQADIGTNQVNDKVEAETEQGTVGSAPAQEPSKVEPEDESGTPPPPLNKQVVTENPGTPKRAREEDVEAITAPQVADDTEMTDEASSKKRKIE